MQAGLIRLQTLFALSALVCLYPAIKKAAWANRPSRYGKVKNTTGLQSWFAVSDLQVCGNQALPAPVEMSLPCGNERLKAWRTCAFALTARSTITDSHQLTRFLVTYRWQPKNPLISTEFQWFRNSGPTPTQTGFREHTGFDDGNARTPTRPH